MRRRWLINLILLLLLIGLSGMIRGELTKAREIPRLTEILASDLYRIEIAREGEPTITLIQNLTGWRMETPMRVDADAELVGQLLGILEAPVHRSFPRESAALDQLDLAPVRLRLRLDARELGFGGIDPIGQSRYVVINDLVHLIDDRFHHLLIAPPIRYVSPDLLPRGFSPVFGRLDGTPLAPETLAALEAIRAERVEILSEDMTGSAVELKVADGTSQRFLVSEDRRRWARLDQRLLYVLTKAPEMVEDPDAIDPTPAEPPLPDLDAAMMTPDPTLPATPVADPSEPPIQSDMVDPFAPPTGSDGSDPPEVDPDSLVPSDAPVSAPPVVRLTPDGRLEPEVARPRNRLRGEPEKMPPQGFGQDPFAPDPAMYPAPNAPDGTR
ncbi:hypothetical protein [Thiocystis violacea]|uniref:hypothetical protein n=1 Tax=Thiocystis violacea TaxID=13725 RepID=UPI0019049247|nr:hypothetical protein [Thiocystis violacea]MBK1720063.1 hypothetical protein [Thiocystis violacea]